MDVQDNARRSSADPEEAPAQKESSRGKRWWMFRLLACTISSLVGAVLITATLFTQEMLVFDRETGFLKFQRPPLYLYEPGYETTRRRYLYDELLGWRNIPNWQATTGGHRLSINSKGLRDGEYAWEKPLGVRRLLVLGDSFAWGYGVSDEEIFTEVLERDLGERWQVINTGVSGWGTDQQFLFLENEGFKYSPDVVVLAFFLYNDPTNNASPKQYGLYKPMFLNADLELFNVPVPRPQQELSRNVATPEPNEITAAIVSALARRCAEQGCPLVVMKFGMFLPQAAPLREADAWFREQFTAIPNVHYLDLDRAFISARANTRELIKGNDDGHWNALGHRLTARILRDFLASEQLLD